jgi:hypothetical protein
VKELELESAGPGTATAPETEAGSQLLTTGKLPARGSGVLGGAVISWLGDGLGVGVPGAIVGTTKLWVGGAGEGVELAGFGEAQPTATRRMTMLVAATRIRRSPGARFMLRFIPPGPLDYPQWAPGSRRGGRDGAQTAGPGRGQVA